METFRFTVAALLLVLAGSGCRSTDPALLSKSVATSSNPTDRIGAIRIEGNSITQDRVIHNQLNFKVGDAVDPAKLAKAESQLARLGIFDGEQPPSVTVGEMDPATGFKTIIVRVKETRTGVVGFGVGVNSNAGIRSDR